MNTAISAIVGEIVCMNTKLQNAYDDGNLTFEAFIDWIQEMDVSFIEGMEDPDDWPNFNEYQEDPEKYYPYVLQFYQS